MQQDRAGNLAAWWRTAEWRRRSTKTSRSRFPPCNAYFFIATMRRHRSAGLLRTPPASARPGFEPTDNRRNSLASFGLAMQIMPKLFCRFFGQRASVTGFAVACSLAAASMLAWPLVLKAEDAASPATEDGAAKAKDGGVMVQVPQSPPLAPLKIGYLREVTEHPRPASQGRCRAQGRRHCRGQDGHRRG